MENKTTNKCLVCENVKHPKVKALEKKKGYHIHTFKRGSKVVAIQGEELEDE